MMEPQPCYRCKVPTFGTFGTLAYCLPCLRITRAGIRVGLRPDPPKYAPNVLRCERCGAIREDGGPADWFELCVHGAHEERGTAMWRCNGRMRRVTIIELERLAAQTSGDAA